MSKTRLRALTAKEKRIPVKINEDLNDQSSEQIVCIVRSFSYFIHLFNIAEDLYAQQITRLTEDEDHQGQLSFSLKKSCIMI